ncbi:hypothetical protein P3T39_001671 [Kitasatospora sp. GP82]|nr:hypothetical protein [Kitasatospora sp. GP82]
MRIRIRAIRLQVAITVRLQRTHAQPKIKTTSRLLS